MVEALGYGHRIEITERVRHPDYIPFFWSFKIVDYKVIVIVLTELHHDFHVRVLDLEALF